MAVRCSYHLNSYNRFKYPRAPLSFHTAVPDYPSAGTHKTLQQVNIAAAEVFSVLHRLKIRCAVKKSMLSSDELELKLSEYNAKSYAQVISRERNMHVTLYLN